MQENFYDEKTQKSFNPKKRFPSVKLTNAQI